MIQIHGQRVLTTNIDLTVRNIVSHIESYLAWVIEVFRFIPVGARDDLTLRYSNNSIMKAMLSRNIERGHSLLLIILVEDTE